PKVMWYAPAKKWIMTLAANDRIIFYSSLNLKDWKEESTFGLGVGSHIGVWECPDLFPLQLEGKTYWVLVVNVNSGGPNKGSATQYFLGGFDGNKFSNMDAATRWLDYGPDEYAGITWSNTGDRKIFLGWMSNWQYANQVPTEKWRNAMTIPRKLSLQRSMEGISIVSKPVAEISNIGLKKTAKISATLPEQWQLKMDISTLDDYCITLSNKSGNQVLIGYDAKAKQYYIDRTKSGKTDFEKNFSGRFTAPRLSAKTSSNLTLVVDASSVELFADDGLSVMTAIYFPDGLLDKFSIKKAANLKFTSRFIPLKSIW
ncbi:MAG: glycoside hydrolase family 32 protein, partial [Sphingobacteriaceae bacterium]